jgi:hypothetical protein
VGILDDSWLEAKLCAKFHLGLMQRLRHGITALCAWMQVTVPENEQIFYSLATSDHTGVKKCSISTTSTKMQIGGLVRKRVLGPALSARDTRRKRAFETLTLRDRRAAKF